MPIIPVMPVKPVMPVCLNASVLPLFYSATMLLFLHYFIVLLFSMPLMPVIPVMPVCLYSCTIL